MKYIFSIIATIFFLLNIHATDYTIATWGNNAAGTGSASNPWASLSYACSQATSPGDKIQINPGVYNDNNQCVLAIGVNIEGAGSDVVTIHSSYNDWYLIGSSATVTNGNHNISGFTLDGNNKTLAHGIRFFGRSYVQIHQVVVQNIDAFGIQITAVNTIDDVTPPSQYVTNVEVNNCTITNCGKIYNGGEYASSCISIGHLQNSYIHDNTISDDIGGGIIFWGWGWFKSLQVYNNSINITGQGSLWGSQSAIELWHLFDDCQVYNNTANNWFSLVYGSKGNGDHSVVVNGNTIIFENPENTKEGVELGLSLYDSEMHHNHIENGRFAVAIWGVADGVDGNWPVSNISVHHNTFYTNLSEYNIGLFINPSDGEIYDNIEIYNNVFDGYDAAIQLEPRSGVGQILNTKIRNNIFKSAPNAVVCQGSDGYQSFQIQNTIVTHNIYDGDNILLESVTTTNTNTNNNVFAAAQINGSGNKPMPFYLAQNGSSNIVDAGVNVGLDYIGIAPDMGAYEYGASSPTVSLNLKAILQAPYNAATQLMNDGLRTSNNIPLLEPFSGSGFTHVGTGGGETTNTATLNISGNNAIVDWILVELRNGSNSGQILATQSALLQRDGDIVSTDGSSSVTFTDNGLPATVYVVLRHRNHLGVRTSNSYATNTIINIDFSSSSTQLFGENSGNIISGVSVLVPGDANGDGQVNNVDRNQFWRLENSNAFNYNYRADFNLDGAVNAIDNNSYLRPNDSRSEELD